MTLLAAPKLQEAVFAALAADSDLNLLLTGLYDEAPAGVGYPYLAMGETSLAAGDLKDRLGGKLNFELFLWSNEASQMQVKELMAATDKVMQEAEIGVLGHDLVTLRLVSASTVRQWSEAGSLYRGRLSYSALLYAS